MKEYRIKHITRYKYASTVIDCVNQIMLFPIQDDKQAAKKHTLKITGDPLVEEFVDYFGNRVGVFSIIKPHNELSIESDIFVTTKEIVLPTDAEHPQEQWVELKNSGDVYPYMDFMFHEGFTSEAAVKNLLDANINMQETPLVNAKRLAKYVYENFEYKKGVTNVETTVDEILKLKAGVCQDFAHLLIFMLRKTGIPARYVSGYISPGNDEMRGAGATHAWVEAYIPFYGWLGLDPTNNCIANNMHVRLAVGRNFSDCTPVKGTYKGSSEHDLEVSVKIRNGKNETNEEQEASPAFSYTSKNPAISTNSYLQYLEMQQQQQ